MEREKIKESWEKRREELCRMADQIYDWAEVGLEETKSSALLEDYLEEQGFAVEKGVGTLPTAFRATWKQGEGGPRLGFLCEYDALEGMGHGCGHHLQGPSVIGAALAVRDRFAGKGVPFSLVIYGTPAEETIGGKTVMMEQGCFQDIDIALMMHAAPTTCVDVKSMANTSYTVEFHGVR
ncbi:M20/M25/M40 family metallo-hydrolase, partial [Acidaminococcus fermentans]|uniref:M20/M25/M40 family metallo-hydrolase n=1 Tax=Acidaminococcus fermentans TaxID=905 RepID=UPI00307A56D4